jgi:hypothetical protein
MGYGIDQVHQGSTTAIGGNPLYNGLEWRQLRTPDYKIFVYNVSARALKTDRFGNRLDRKVEDNGMSIPGVDENDVCTVTQGGPPANSLPQSKFLVELSKLVDLDTGKGKVVRAGKENEKWHLWTSFPQPILLTKANDAANTIESYEQDAIRYVVDLINPNNLGRTLDNPTTGVSQNVDMSQSGLFFSLANPPFETDLRAAIDRMEKHYKNLLERAATLELTDKAALAQELGSNPDYAFAADYFGKVVSWRRAPQRTVECPNCGGQKPAGRLFHMGEFGLCVEQSEAGWRAAVNSGVKRYEDVPDDFRWKKEPKEKG